MHEIGSEFAQGRAEKASGWHRWGRSHVFEGVAHMVNLERPEEFTTLVLEFLAEVDTPGSDGTAQRAC